MKHADMTRAEKSARQNLREAFCAFLDEVERTSKSNRRHLLWWFAKESLYQLGVLNGDIEEG